MIKALIIADDFTGALDTGVKFSAAGARTKVSMDMEFDFTIDIPEEVLVLCAPTRHLQPQDAYDIICRITQRAAAAKIPCIFKKTDSALRGNIGAELSAALCGSGRQDLCFIPAMPGMKRITSEGIHYIDGVPVHQSIFGKDPFEPVRESYVPDLLHLQCEVPVRLVPHGQSETFWEDTPCIHLFDCTTKEDMETTVRELSEQDHLDLVAGCAGLAESLHPYLGLTSDSDRDSDLGTDRLLVICGSVNPISKKQMDYGERWGFKRLHLPARLLLDDDSLTDGSAAAVMEKLWNLHRRAPYLIIDSLQPDGRQLTNLAPHLSMEQIRQKVSHRIGEILKILLDRGYQGRIMIVGGDTLLEFLESIGCRELVPACELQPGVVLSRIIYRERSYEIISKSGGFGEEDLLVAMQKNNVLRNSAIS